MRRLRLTNFEIPSLVRLKTEQMFRDFYETIYAGEEDEAA